MTVHHRSFSKGVHHRLQITICIGTFLLEKEGWKTLTHHGLLHIKSMDSTQYIPSPPHWQHPWPLTRENLVHQNGHLVTLLDYLYHLLYADYHWDCIFLLSRSIHKALTLILVLLHCDLFYHCTIRSDSSTPILVLLHRDLCTIPSATSTTFLGRSPSHLCLALLTLAATTKSI